MAKVINFIESHVGNAGNSLFTSYLVEFFVKYNLKHILVDLDSVNPDVGNRYDLLGNLNKDIKIHSKSKLGNTSLLSLIDLVFESDTQAIVNVPARSLEYVENFIDGYDFEEVRLRRWFVSNLDRKSWNIFEMTAEYDEEKYAMILVHNMVDGLEMTSYQREFCENRGIEIIKMSWIQLPNNDKILIDSNPTIPLNAILSKLSELGHKRLEVGMNRIFEWIAPIVVGR